MNVIDGTSAGRRAQQSGNRRGLTHTDDARCRLHAHQVQLPQVHDRPPLVPPVREIGFGELSEKLLDLEALAPYAVGGALTWLSSRDVAAGWMWRTVAE
ncbi:hypothetical protein [Streptomyces achromogenes]|uniref:hypothetical protein n=1 Tax=Streptomyces achromogenes TaxID=67255 RepID=UPI0036FF7DDD